MQNFIDHRLGQRAARQFRRVVTGNTRIVTLDSGDEVRNAMWRYKQMKFTASFALLSREAQEEVVSAFWAANAMLYLFRFRDYGDYQVADCPLSVTAGSTTPVQLVKRYTFGAMTAERILQAVDTCKVFDAITGDPIAGALDGDLGTFTPAAEWPESVKWSGTFSCWVRFGSDELDITMETMNLATTQVELFEKKASR